MGKQSGTFMRLVGNRLYLRPLELIDTEGDYPNWLNDPIVCQYNSHGDNLYTREMAAEYIHSVQNNPNSNVFAICMIENDRHIGNIALQQISLKNRNAELAILIGEKEVYGQGIGYEAALLLVEYAFEYLKLHRLYCGTHSENIGMQKLALKLGMRQEGVRREALFKNGSFANIVEYGMLSDEFLKDR